MAIEALSHQEGTMKLARSQEDTSMKSSVVRTLSCAIVLVMLAASTHQTAAVAAQLEGATLADTLKAGEKTLKLNGLGLRKKAMFKVYVGGLYLESPSKDAGAILASDQAKAIRMHFLRDLSKAQLVEAFQEGFESNAKDKAAQKAAFDKMLALVPDVKTGSTLTFTYLPGKGTTLQVADKELGVFEGKGFADAVFSIWLGSKPPSEDLKKGMLG
jgi:Chalcone isomerase-like